jgi:hypothetical protein
VCGQCGLLLDWASDHGAFSEHCLKLATVSLPKACSLLPAQIVVAFSPSPFLLIVSVTARLLPSSICSDRASSSSLSCHHAIIWCGSPNRSVAALEVGELYPLAWLDWAGTLVAPPVRAKVEPPAQPDLTELRFRCSQCGTDRTDFVVTSRDNPQPWDLPLSASPRGSCA